MADLANSAAGRIAQALLDDEQTSGAASFVFMKWLLKQPWGHMARVDADLNVQVSLRPEWIPDEGGGYLGDSRDEDWLTVTVAVDADTCGDDGPASARSAAAKLATLAKDLIEAADSGAFGKEQK